MVLLLIGGILMACVVAWVVLMEPPEDYFHSDWEGGE